MQDTAEGRTRLQNVVGFVQLKHPVPLHRGRAGGTRFSDKEVLPGSTPGRCTLLGLRQNPEYVLWLLIAYSRGSIPCPHSQLCLSGGIGRHAALRTQCLTACGFDSCLGYLVAMKRLLQKVRTVSAALPALPHQCWDSASESVGMTPDCLSGRRSSILRGVALL